MESPAATVLSFVPKRGISSANFFSRVDVWENQVYCKTEVGAESKICASRHRVSRPLPEPQTASNAAPTG